MMNADCITYTYIRASTVAVRYENDDQYICCFGVNELRMMRTIYSFGVYFYFCVVSSLSFSSASPFFSFYFILFFPSIYSQK